MKYDEVKYCTLNPATAKSEDYPMSGTPKQMQVWNEDDDYIVPTTREVFGFFNGYWIAADINGKGVCQWDHAAELPEAKPLHDLVKAVKKDSSWFPYVVHPGDEFSELNIPDCIAVPERNLLNKALALSNKEYTFLVLPGCCDFVKNMFARITDENDHANVVFLKRAD